tara:strand:+ start:14352 stop:15014 length:663 start_codon:yes stop_codon:yes gene_type:complete
MKFFYRIYRKFGMAFNLNFIGFYQSLFWKNEGKDQEIRFKYRLEENDVVFDLGAFKGEFTEKLYNEKAKFYLFDTNPEMIMYLKERFKVFSNILISPYGLGSRDVYGDTKYSFFPWARAGATYTEVKSSKLVIMDFIKFCEEKKINNIELLKINIEGAEYDLLKYLYEKNFLPKINHIQIQPHDFENESLGNLLELHRNLHKTHNLKLSYPFVWDFWQRK